MLRFRLFLLGLSLACWPATAQAQKIQIQLGPDEIGENQAWTIALTVQNDQLRSYGSFPDIPGLRKRGTSTNSQTNIINGQVSSAQSVIMTYTPTQQGLITVPPFTVKINDQTIQSPGKKIKVGPPVQYQSRDPFRSLFDNRDPYNDPAGRSEPEFVDIKEDALLALSTNKDEVYVGEGFTATLSFLVADNNRAPMQFHDLGRQLSEILKKLKPSNCRGISGDPGQGVHAIQDLPGNILPTEHRSGHVPLRGPGNDQIQGRQESFVLRAKPTGGFQDILLEAADSTGEGTATASFAEFGIRGYLSPR